MREDCHALTVPRDRCRVVAIVIFFVQNRSLVTILFLVFGVPASLAILAALVYVLGTITGDCRYALLRKSIRESQLTKAR